MSQDENPADKSIASFTEAAAKTFRRRFWKKIRRLGSGPEPDVEAAVDDPRVLVEDCVRRAVDPSLTLLGVRRRGAAEHHWPADAGYGELLTFAHAEIKRELDLHAIEPGTELATVLVDLDAWEYDVVFEEFDEPALRADGGLELPPTQGFVNEDDRGQYVVCAGVDDRFRPCRGRMRLDEAESDDAWWVWACPDCDERLIQARGGRR